METERVIAESWYRMYLRKSEEFDKCQEAMMESHFAKLKMRQAALEILSIALNSPIPRRDIKAIKEEI
jgi:chromosome segregation and condensation protein ScpB